MKKCTLLVVLFTSLIFNARAQFATGGTQISYASANNHRPFVSAMPGGNYYATWVVTQTGNINVVKLGAYDQRGVVLPGWTSGGKNMGPSTGNFYSPQIITSEDSGVIIAWHGTLGDSAFSRIYAQKYTRSGQALWNNGNPLQVTTGTGNVDQNPMLISDGNNGAYIAWTRYDLSVAPNSSDVYLQRITGNGTVPNGWAATGTGVATTPGLQECWPQLALTPDQTGVYVTYASGPAQATSLIINRFNATNGAIATGWTAAGQIVSAGPNVLPAINCNAKLFTDVFNNAIVFWLEQRTTVNGEIYMQQISPTGSALLAAKGLLLAGRNNNGQGVNNLQVIPNTTEDFLITYNNLVTNNDVAAMRVQPNGTVLWSDSLITTGGASGYPYPVSDGNGGLYIFYANTNTPEKLYALAIDQQGHTYNGWTLPGSSFGALSNYDPSNPNYDINAVAIGNGQAVVTWNRLVSSGYYEIFACNLLTTGKTCTQCIPVTTNHQGNVTLCQGHELTLNITPDPYMQYTWLINNGSSIDSSSSIHVADSGSYTVIVHNTQQNCSDTSNTVTVSLSASPVVTLSSLSTESICNNAQAITLSGGSPAGGVFSGPGVATGNVFNPVQAALGDNVIVYTYTNSSGCSSSATQSITINNCFPAGVEPVTGAKAISIYPNPANQFFIISGAEAGTNSILQVHDIMGNILLSIPVTNPQTEISTAGMANGFYIITLAKDNAVLTAKMVVNR